LRAVRGAQNAFINLEDLTEEDLVHIKERYAKLAELAREKSGMTPPPSSMVIEHPNDSAVEIAFRSTFRVTAMRPVW
jgi:hypothetical protein